MIVGGVSVSDNSWSPGFVIFEAYVTNQAQTPGSYNGSGYKEESETSSFLRVLAHLATLGHTTLSNKPQNLDSTKV